MLYSNSGSIPRPPQDSHGPVSSEEESAGSSDNDDLSCHMCPMGPLSAESKHMILALFCQLSSSFYLWSVLSSRSKDPFNEMGSSFPFPRKHVQSFSRWLPTKGFPWTTLVCNGICSLWGFLLSFLRGPLPPNLNSLQGEFYLWRNRNWNLQNHSQKPDSIWPLIRSNSDSSPIFSEWLQSQMVILLATNKVMELQLLGWWFINKYD